MRRREQPYQNLAVTPPASKRVLVPVPAPHFASADEAIAYREAVQSVARQPGEELIDWLRRVSEHAQGTTVTTEG